MSHTHAHVHAPGEQCVCNICTCGKHHCRLHAPSTSTGGVTSGSKAEPMGKTTQQEDFIPTFVAPRSPYKPAPSQHRSSAPFVGITTQKQDFTPKRGQSARQPMVKPPGNAITPQGNMEFNPLSRTDFKVHPKVPQATKVVPTDNLRPHSGGVPTFVTTNMVDMKPWTPEKQPSVKPAPVIAWNGDRPLPETESLYKKDYPEHQPSRVAPIKPLGSTLTLGEGSSTPSKSTMAADFDPKKVEVPQPFKPPATRVNNTGKMEASSVAAAAFQPLPFAKREPYKPQQQRQDPGTFRGTTTAKTDFPQWPVASPSRTKPEQKYVKPTQPFEGQTISQASFIAPKQRLRREPVKPPGPSLRPTGSIEFNTTYGDDMKKWQPVSPTRVKPAAPAPHTPPPFNAKTEAQTQYQPKAASRAPAIVPMPSTIGQTMGSHSKSPLKGTTEMRAQYIPKSMECPALRLPRMLVSTSRPCSRAPHSHRHPTPRKPLMTTW
eukprot:m.165877 g.165877  ORF g.165877 m.165877 type:complete len:489 (-) comp14437_c0_seq3:499-1965(-)